MYGQSMVKERRDTVVESRSPCFEYVLSPDRWEISKKECEMGTKREREGEECELV